MLTNRLLIVLPFVLLASGCDTLKVYDSDFSCQESLGQPVCKPSSEIYNDSLENKLPYQRGTTGAKDEQSKQTTTAHHGTMAGAQSTPSTPVAKSGAKDVTKQVETFPAHIYFESSEAQPPVPIRKRPVVMRVYIAPWEDENDRLLMPQYAYQEIEKSTWNVGNDNTLLTPGVPAATIREEINVKNPAVQNRVRPKANPGQPFGRSQGYEQVPQQ